MAGLGSAPVNTALPMLSGTAQQGQNLSASTGSWSGSPTGYSYQWQRCDSAGNNCANIAGGTSSGLTLGSADVGSTLRATVTASNGSGSASATSAPSAVVAALSSAPANTALPTISGTAAMGSTLTATPGAWTGSPTAYAFQWKRCNSGGSKCSSIAGVTSGTYTVGSTDRKSTIRVTVTASNSAGSASATSSQTAVVH